MKCVENLKEIMDLVKRSLQKFVKTSLQIFSAHKDIHGRHSNLQQWESINGNNGIHKLLVMVINQWQLWIFNNDNCVWLSITPKISIKAFYYDSSFYISHVWLLHPKNLSIFFIPNVGIKPLKARHDVTKLDLIVLFLLLWCIDIDLSIQTMSLTLYMTRVY